ncbi:hypothetical protein [Streptosporangium sp. CA-115845]
MISHPGVVTDLIMDAANATNRTNRRITRYGILYDARAARGVLPG